MDEAKKLWVRVGVLLALILILAALTLPAAWREQAASALGSLGTGSGLSSGDGFLTVAFLDVGQGDAIYIETPDGVQVLIDGGPDGIVLEELASVMPLFDRTLDVVLVTHTDKDHVGGLVDVLSRYKVERIVKTENQNDTETAETFSALAEVEKNAEVIIAGAGQQYTLGASTTLLIISPKGDPTNWESNSASIVAQLQYGDTAFMLTGDAPVGIEDYLVNSYGEILKSDVLKLGHHGSKTSSGELFLKTVLPSYAIVSAGEDNRYGHPHQDVLERVGDVQARVLNTASLGTIIFKSDGKKVWAE
jgi:competence protein ComEC